MTGFGNHQIVSDAANYCINFKTFTFQFVLDTKQRQEYGIGYYYRCRHRHQLRRSPKFGKEGYRIALIARNETKLKQLATSLQQEGIDVIYAAGDVAQEDSLKGALDQISEAGGIADMILYNPSGASNKDILDLDWETIKDMLDISVGGYFNLMKMVLPSYLRQNHGKLFVTGGGLSLSGDPRMTALSMGKAAQRNLVQAFQKGRWH